jgi:hypothetical protein
MTTTRDRVNIYDRYDYETVFVGWFDRTAARAFEEDEWWDGSNYISVATDSQWEHEELYRTAGGRWVLHSWSQWQGTRPGWEFVSDEAARTWLLRNHHDKAVIEFFGSLDAEADLG